MILVVTLTHGIVKSNSSGQRKKQKCAQKELFERREGEHFIVTEYTSPPVKDQTHSNQNDFTFRSSTLVKRMTEYFFFLKPVSGDGCRSSSISLDSFDLTNQRLAPAHRCH